MWYVLGSEIKAYANLCLCIFPLIFVLGCTQDENKDLAIELSCSNSSHSWVVSSITCDGAPTQNKYYLSLFYQPGEKVFFQRGDRDCFEKTEWKVKLGQEKGETFFVPLSGRKCFQGSNLNEVSSCQSDYFQCQSSKEPINFQNNYSTCAIISEKMILERYVSTRIASQGFSFCQAGQQESLELSIGDIREPEPIKKPMPTQLVILDPSDTTVGLSTSIVVQAQTSTGIRVDDYSGEVTLTASGSATGEGVLTLTAGEGRIDLQNQVAEQVFLGLIDSGGTGLDVTSTQDIVFSAGETDNLFFQVQPSSTDSYETINPVIEVLLRDAFGNVVSHSTESVTLSLGEDPSAGSASLIGGVTQNATGGVARFDDINIDYPALGYRLQASTAGGISVLSALFDINPTGIVEVSDLSQTFTDENGAHVRLDLRLNKKPLADVEIPLQVSDSTEASLNTSLIRFTPSNWSTPQVIQVTGLSDSLADGNVEFQFELLETLTSDPNFQNIDLDDYRLVNVDSGASPGVQVSSLVGEIDEFGATGVFSVVLESPPTQQVDIDLTVSDSTEVAINKTKLIFNQENWHVAQEVNVQGLDDALEDGDQPFRINIAPTISANPAYDGIDPRDIEGFNFDNDKVGIHVTNISSDTSESGDSAQFSVRLSSAPSGNVTLPLQSTNTNEGDVDKTSLVFTPSNWRTPQWVIVQGLDDAKQDGDQIYSIELQATSSSDLNYNGINPPDIFLRNLDNDSHGFIISELTGDTDEEGSEQSFTVKLQSPPADFVDLSFNVSDSSEIRLDKTSLRFEAANWNQSQTVTVEGLDDALQDGDQNVEVKFNASSSTDPNYNNLILTGLELKNLDNDSTGFRFNPSLGLVTSEGGNRANLKVSLKSAPSGEVTLNFNNPDLTEVALSKSTLVFNGSNWMQEQEVIFSGVDDALQDGTILINVITEPASSSDPNYNNLDPQDIVVSNQDDDTPGIRVTPLTGNTDRITLNEAGGEQVVFLSLASEPTSNVTLNFSSNDPSEGSVSKSQLAFTKDNWNIPQEFTVSSVDDLIQDGPTDWEVEFAAPVSADADYAALLIKSVFVTTKDDDTPGVSVFPDTQNHPVIVNEYGSSQEFEIVLNSEPTEVVTVSIASRDNSEANTSTPVIRFTPDNWNVAQTVIINGVDDNNFDNHRNVNFSLNVNSPDPSYNGVGVNDIRALCIDNELREIFATPSTSAGAGAVKTSEQGKGAFIDVLLTTQPSDLVFLPYASSDNSEGVVSGNQLIFTPENWDSPQRIWITGVDDDIKDGDQSYQLQFGQAASNDFGYRRERPDNMNLINLDDD